MHEEVVEISDEAARQINDSKRVVSVGTTTVRALESAAKNGRVYPYRGFTSLFIKPGFSFQVVEALQTNFHLPESTLFVLACAFGETSFIKHCYEEAIRERYRLFSYGDTMLIL